MSNLPAVLITTIVVDERLLDLMLTIIVAQERDRVRYPVVFYVAELIVVDHQSLRKLAACWILLGLLDLVLLHVHDVIRLFVGELIEEEVFGGWLRINARVILLTLDLRLSLFVLFKHWVNWVFNVAHKTTIKDSSAVFLVPLTESRILMELS